MSDNIFWLLETTINDGQHAALDALQGEMITATKGEAGALNYEWFIDGDRCSIYERYADNAAAMAHIGNFGANFAERFMTCLSIDRFSIFGPANDELRQVAANFGASVMAPTAGFVR